MLSMPTQIAAQRHAWQQGRFSSKFCDGIGKFCLGIVLFLLLECLKQEKYNYLS